MNTYANKSENFINIDTLSIKKLFLDEPIKKIAVLFTDIVGSTDYFKTHGDKHGREMLRKHHNIASSMVRDYGGKVLKLIGDSIMAYFLDPTEAFKAAIKMQQKFQSEGGHGNSDGKMHVRVGIHYGSVIFEKEDIYGDVVNVASKLTNLAQGGQVYISREVYNFVKDIPFAHFELIPKWNSKNLSLNLMAYKVYWDAAIVLNPSTSTMLFVHPVKELTDDSFIAIWDALICSESALWAENIRRKIIFPDKSMVMFLTENNVVVDILAHIRDFLSDKLKETGKHTILPVQIIIDVSNNSSEDDLISSGYNFNHEIIKPGTINFSEDASHIIKYFENASLVHINKETVGKNFYRLISKNDELKDEPGMFPYGDALIQGPNIPCFYCGSKKHICKNCPSKNLPDITNALDRLGYLPLDAVNEFFLKLFFLNEDDADAEKGEDEEEPDVSKKLPFYSFYELTRTYQLRFLRAIWDVTGEDWLAAIKRKSKTQGGMAWLALDSLRVHDPDKAEAALKKAIENSPNNFRVYCISGFSYIEKDDFVQASNCFEKALTYTKSDVHRISIQLLIARLCRIVNKLDDALKIISDIISKNPYCNDAVYMYILIKLQQQKESIAITHLVKLIQSNRKYFMHTYIDPELMPYSNLIVPELITLFKKAKEDALSLLPQAENEFLKSKKMHDKRSVAENQSLFLKTKNALEQNSYYGYLDAANYCNLIISNCKELFSEKKIGLVASLHLLSNRIEKNLKFIYKFKYNWLTMSCGNQLKVASEKVEKALGSVTSISQENFYDYLSLHDKIQEEMKNVEVKLKNMDYLESTARGCFKLLKYGLISLSIVFSTSFFILPHLFYYLNIALVQLNASPVSNVSFYQKLFFVSGGIISFCLILSSVIKEFNKNY